MQVIIKIFGCHFTWFRRRFTWLQKLLISPFLLIASKIISQRLCFGRSLQIYLLLSILHFITLYGKPSLLMLIHLMNTLFLYLLLSI